MKGIVVALVNCGGAREAETIARAVVEERLAACVNIHEGAVRSVYRWKGKVERAREALLVIKTTKRLFARLERRVKTLHSYRTPEILALPVVAVSKDYGDWVERSLGRARR